MTQIQFPLSDDIVQSSHITDMNTYHERDEIYVVNWVEKINFWQLHRLEYLTYHIYNCAQKKSDGRQLFDRWLRTISTLDQSLSGRYRTSGRVSELHNVDILMYCVSLRIEKYSKYGVSFEGDTRSVRDSFIWDYEMWILVLGVSWLSMISWITCKRYWIILGVRKKKSLLLTFQNFLVADHRS